MPPPSSSPCDIAVITPGSGNIRITGLDASPVVSVQVFTLSYQTIHNCWDNACDKPISTIETGEGSFRVFVRFYDANFNLICTIEEVITVSGSAPPPPPPPVDPCANRGGDSDGDGICNFDDCAPNNANFPATPGTACNDGKADTENDIISADGCSCAGTPIVVDPCANKGGDANGNGICDDDEVAPPPSGDPCSGISITSRNGEIKISGLDAAPVVAVQVFTPSYQTIHNCWDNACDKPMSTIATGAGSFLVFVKFYDSAFGLICEIQETITVGGSAPPPPPVDPCANRGGDSNNNGICDNDEVPVDPCANQGGDSDGDGICDNQDNCPTTFNANQADSNGNGIGDVCDVMEEVLVTYNTCQEVSRTEFQLGLQSRASCIGANTTNIMPTVTRTRITSCQDLNPGAGDGETFLLCFDPDQGDLFTDIFVTANTTLSSLDLTDVLASSEELCRQSGNLFPFTIDITVNNRSVYSDSRFITNRLTDYNFNLGSINVNNGSVVRITISADNGNLRDDCGIMEFSGLSLSGSCGAPVVDPCASRGGDSDGNGICDDDEVPVDPCANRGGDSNGNGVCDNDEAPPATGGCQIAYTSTRNSITVTGVNELSVVKLFDTNAGWSVVYECNLWGSSKCGTTQAIRNLSASNYYLTVETFDASYNLLCDLEEHIIISGLNSTVSGLVSSQTENVTLAQNRIAKQSATGSTNSSQTISSVPTTATQNTTLSVYPNPAYDQLNISLAPYTGLEGELQLLNGIGQVVATRNVESIDASPIQIGLNRVNAGMYYLQVVVDGALVDLQKVIVEKR